jgi:hypothetical protein
MARYNVTVPAGTSTTLYVPVMEKCNVLSGFVTVSGAPGASSTVEVYAGATKVGTATLATDAAAGSRTAVTMDATVATRKTATETSIKLVCASSNSIAMGISLDCDEFVRTHD